MLWVLLGLTVLNTLLLIVIGAFMVRLRERVNDLFAGLFMVMEESWDLPMPTMESTPSKKKTWDEKYEDELELQWRRMRGDSGLKDLPDPTATWGEPPAPNPDNQDGLTIRDK